jgi:LuxR family transcriptional regulator, quorum-sensing system regulator BjaR1
MAPGFSQRLIGSGFSRQTLSLIEGIDRASTPQAVLEVYEKGLSEIGAEYIGIIFLPRPEERVEDACLAWKVPADWRALYSGENFFQRDPAVRQSRRSVLPFDWASAPYDQETEPHLAEVMDRARDFNVHKGISVPIPSPSGIIGTVWVAGPHFNDREVYKPLLHSLALHVFHRLEQLMGRRLHKDVRLTEREREILAWASEGKTAWEIGRILGLSQRTVEWHVGQACKKLGATNRLQAIAILGDMRGVLEPIIIEEAPAFPR